MPQQWCERCWTIHSVRTPAEWDIDGDLYCSNCKQSVGYEETDGKRLGRADALASAAPVPDKRKKAHGEAVPIPERLARAIDDAPSAVDLLDANERFEEAIDEAFRFKPDVPRRTNGGSKMELKRTCSVEGCARRITLENKSGRCSAHWYVPKNQRLAAPGAAAPKKKTGVKRSHPNGNGHAMATICVPASALDSWWAKLSLDEKAELFTNSLSQVFA